MRVADDADDLAFGLIGKFAHDPAPNHELVAQRIAVCPELFGHRLVDDGDVRGVRYVDDSKGTNVGATLAAVAGMSGPLVVIAGGQGKGQNFAPLAPAFRNKVRNVVLIGQDAKQVADALSDTCPFEFADSMERAVTLAAQSAKAGDTVLLSPACASLDMFRDYAQRGDVFAAAVRGLSA